MRSTIPADSTPRSAISAPRNTRIATPSELSKPPPKTVHHQGRTPAGDWTMSALPPIADIGDGGCDVGYGPGTDFDGFRQSAASLAYGADGPIDNRLVNIQL